MFVESHGQPVVYVDRAVWPDVAVFLRDERAVHDVLDVTAVDHLVDIERLQIAGVAPERFEVVANFLSHPRNLRVRLISEVPEDDPTVASLADEYPGVDFAEREVYDMFGITFDGPPRPHPHPHARRLGGPPAAQGRRAEPRAGHVQGRPGPAMSVRSEATGAAERAVTKFSGWVPFVGLGERARPSR